MLGQQNILDNDFFLFLLINSKSGLLAELL